MSAQRARALEPGNAASARALVHRALGGSRHAGRVLELLDVAISGTDAECVGLVDAGVDPSLVSGLVLSGPVAGATGVLKIHALVGANADVLVTLVNALVLGPQGRAARLIVCEIADDPACAGAAAALRASAFTREGRVEDFFADGVDLDVLVLRP